MSEHAYAAPLVSGHREACRRAWPEARTMAIRSLRLSLRNVDALITAFALPVMLMLMFVYLFGGAIHTGTRYVEYVVPGVLLVRRIRRRDDSRQRRSRPHQRDHRPLSLNGCPGRGADQRPCRRQRRP